MGASIRIKWHGDKYTKGLYKYTDNKMHNLAFKILEKAKILAPEDTGALREHIAIRRMGLMKYIVYSSMMYSLYVEYGTSKKAPHPYLRPAASASNLGKL